MQNTRQNTEQNTGKNAQHDSEQKKIITRFAPSPTGFLHIGGARTALFNWLFARHNRGKFLLRIEDTDRARSTHEAIDAILGGMRWLGLDWDDDIILQSVRAERHVEVAHQLLTRGHAYHCYLSSDELAAMRTEAQAKAEPFRVQSPWRNRNRTHEDSSRGTVGAPVVRLRAPREGRVSIADRIQGTVSVDNAQLDDFILLRSDGSPTYMLSVVVDDYDMGITHIIRGDDHLNNAFRQLAIIRAMGWQEPDYAHVPLIHGADGKKLSKRHGALGVKAYHDELGYLPEAVNNYLLRLGWGHGDDEIISRQQAIEWFNLDQVGRSPSRFDSKKLINMTAHYLRNADDARLTELVTSWLSEKNQIPLSSKQKNLLERAMPVLKPRAKTLGDIANASRFLFATVPLDIDKKAHTVLETSPVGLLSAVTKGLVALETWANDTIEEVIRREAENASVALGSIAQPLRVALTGKTTSPGIFDVLLLLGRENSLERLTQCIPLTQKPHSSHAKIQATD